MTATSSYSRFIQALNVMNAALERHRESPIFRPFIHDANIRLRGRDLVVAIVKTDENPVPCDHVTIQFKNGTFVLIAHGRTADEIDWTVSEEYLADVATHPRQYLERPHRLDFDWLKQRMRYSSVAAVGIRSAPENSGPG